MTILGQIARGINVDPAGGFAQGQNEAQVSLQNNMNLLNQVEARARQQRMPNLIHRMLAGDQNAAGEVLTNAPQAFTAVANLQNQQANRAATLQAAMIKANTPPSDVRTLAFLTGKSVDELSQDPNIRKAALAGAFSGGTNINFPGFPSAEQQASANARFAGIEKQEKELATRSGKALDQLDARVENAQNTLAYLDRFEGALLSANVSGPITKATLPWKQFFVNLEDTLGAQGRILSQEERANVGDLELANSAGRRLQLAMSEFFKGAISDTEQTIAEATVVGLGTTVEGNLMIISMLREMAKRQQIINDRVTADFMDARRLNRVFNARASINKHRKKLSESEPFFNRQFMTQQLENSNNPRALIAQWNKSPRLINRLKSTNVFPSDATARELEKNPANVGQLVIIGNRIGRITQ